MRYGKYNPLERYAKIVGQICRDARQRQKLPLSHVSKAVGIDTSMISRFERGECQSFWLLFYYVVFLGANIDCIYNTDYYEMESE